MSHYALTKALAADFVQRERSQRYKGYKMADNLDLIHDMIELGAADSAIATRFGVTPQAVGNFRRGQTYRWYTR